MPVSTLSAAIDELIGDGPEACADAESMVSLRRELARLEAVIATATARFDADRTWEADGAQTAAAWLAWRCHLPRPTARRQVSLGRRLRHLPACEEAWLDGRITGHHVATIAAVRRPETEEALARDEKLLVDNATHMRFEGFATVVAYWAQRADPDGAEDDDRDRRRQREVHLSESFRGMWLGKITLDPISGTIVAGELARLERELFHADWADAKNRLGHDPTVFDLARTPAQRRADALVEMATRSRSMPPGAKRPGPLFTVLVGYETMHGPLCELAGGTALAPGALIPWLDQAYIERAVWGPANRIEVSHRARLFTGATRRALEIRDRACTHKTCDCPAEECQGDHIIPYAADGPTTQENGQLQCSFHNRLRNKGGP